MLIYVIYCHKPSHPKSVHMRSSFGCIPCTLSESRIKSGSDRVLNREKVCICWQPEACQCHNFRPQNCHSTKIYQNHTKHRFCMASISSRSAHFLLFQGSTDSEFHTKLPKLLFVCADLGQERLRQYITCINTNSTKSVIHTCIMVKMLPRATI